MRNYLHETVATVAIAAAAVMASATPAEALVTLFSGDATASADVARPAGTTFQPGSGAGGGLVGGPIVFHDPIDQPGLLITVQDCCLIGDVYEVILDGVSLGITSPQPIGGPTLSSGVFEYRPTGGISASTFFSLEIWDITLSYLGEESPFGGGIVPDNYDPAGLSITVESIPEPASMALLGSALLGFGVAARRRKREPAMQEAA